MAKNKIDGGEDRDFHRREQVEIRHMDKNDKNNFIT